MSALAAAAVLIGSQTAAAAATHVVAPGESLWSIAQEYNTTVPQLATLNGVSDPSMIMVGTTLKIDPGSPSNLETSSADSGGATRTYTVEAGDTLSKIAYQFGVTVPELVRLNNIANANIITVGAVLVIPAGNSSSSAVKDGATTTASTPATAGSNALHLVSAGETLSSIAKQYGVTVEALARANGIADANVLMTGTLLKVPGSASVSDSSVMLRGMPTMHQSLPLSCESAAASIATAYWGSQISEWTFINSLPQSPDPHLGFRGSMTGSFGGTNDYGVYAEPLVPILNRYGFVGDVFYAEGNADLLKDQILAGHPVQVWITNMTSVQQKSYDWYDGQRYALVPQEHSVVVYGYDANGVYVVDPGDGAYRTFSWANFMRSWGYFDGMSLAIYPA